MIKDKIAKLETPECDAEENKEAWRDPNQWVTELGVSWGKARSLEQRLAAAVMVIDRAMRVSDLSLDKEAVETLAAIKGGG